MLEELLLCVRWIFINQYHRETHPVNLHVESNVSKGKNMQDAKVYLQPGGWMKKLTCTATGSVLHRSDRAQTGSACLPALAPLRWS